MNVKDKGSDNLSLIYCLFRVSHFLYLCPRGKLRG